MKNTTSIISLIVLLFLSLALQAQQVAQRWSKTIPEGVNWQMVTSLGNYVVGTSKGLTGINPETGEILWSNTSLGAVEQDRVNQVGSSALIAVSLEGAIYAIDPFSGSVKFNSKEAGVAEVKDRKILYLANGILVSGRDMAGKDILLMTSLDNGKVAWKIDDDFGRLITASEISAKELLIVTLFYNYKINPSSGEVIWRNDISEANQQMESLGALGGLMKQAASQMAQNVDFNVSFYRHPTEQVFYLASEQEGSPQSSGGFTSTTTTGSGPSYHTIYTAFNLTNGERIWKKPLDLSGKIGAVYFDKSGLVIMPDDGANTKVNSYDYTTQEGKWGKKGKGVKVRGGIYNYSKVDGGLVLVSQNTAGKNFISYLDERVGELTFDKPVQIDGTLIYSESTSKGLVYQTTSELNILDVNAGALLIPKGISTTPDLSAKKGNLLYAFDVREGVLKSLDKNTGALEIISTPIAFEGKEAPSNLELRDNGFLLKSSQNMALVGLDKKIVYQKYYEAPREKGIIRALQYAQAVRAAYISAASYTASAAFQSAGQEARTADNQSTAVVLDGVGDAYGQLGDAASDFAKQSFKAANARYKATQEANDFAVVLTKVDKDHVLLKVNKNTGATEASISLGSDNAPNYNMDGVTGMVFYLSAKNTINGYQL